MNFLEVIDTWIEPTPLWGVLMCAFATSSWSHGSLSRFFASLLSPLWQRDFQHELLVPILGKPLISARRPIRLDLSLSSSYSRSCAKNRGKPLTKLSPYNASRIRETFIEPADLGQGIPPHERVGSNEVRRPLSSLMPHRRRREDPLGFIVA